MRITHGLSRLYPKEYAAWGRMMTRCYNPNTHYYKDYGGRGILVCDRWREFQHFFSDLGPMPFPGAQLGRKDNDGPYSPDNCTWTSLKEQSRNKQNTRWITFQGVTKSLADWAEEYGIRRDTLRWRLERGWTLERIFTAARGGRDTGSAISRRMPQRPKKPPNERKPGHCVLTKKQVHSIRKALREGAKGIDLAHQYGVAKSTISAVKTGVNWK